MKVFLILFIFFSYGEPATDTREVVSVDECLAAATAFLAKKPEEFYAIGLGAACRAQLQGVKA